VIFLRSILFLTGAIFGVLFFYCLAHRRNQLSALFSLMSLAVIIYAVGYAFELGARDIEEISFWLKFEYFGLPFIPAFWFIFAYKSHFKKDPPPHGYFVLLIIPLLTIFLSATNEYHHLHYSSISAISVDGQLIAQLGKGPWYYVFVAYSNLTVALSLVVFFIQWKASKLGTASRAFWMFLGAACVAVFEALYLLGLAPYDLDLTAFGLFGAALFQAVAIVRYDFLKSDELVKDIVFSGISEGILILDAQDRISDYNKAGGALFPWLLPDALGKRLDEFPDGAAMEAAAERNKRMKLRVGQRTRYFEAKMTKLLDGGKAVGKVYMFKDVTALHRILSRLYRLANYDTLTKIFNRRRFFDEAEKEVSRVRRYGGRLALLMIDLDLFKDVNDMHGHQAGDAVLEAVAETLRRRVRSTDILGRYGGEEFVVVLAAMDPGKALEIAEDLRKSIAELRVSHGGTVISTTVSIGVANTAAEGGEIALERLLLDADRALYRAKREGRNRVCVWRDEAQ